jgi:adenosine deaminase
LSGTDRICSASISRLSSVSNSSTPAPANTLAEYLELHTLVESVQTEEALPYFIYRLIRGAYIFENLAYLGTALYPLPAHPGTSELSPIASRRWPQIVEVVGRACQQHRLSGGDQADSLHAFPKLPYEVNRAIVDLAAQYPEYVCAVDLAGGDAHYGERHG